MKKFILSILLSMCICISACAKNTNTIRQLNKNQTANIITSSNGIEIVKTDFNIAVKSLNNSKYLNTIDNSYRLTLFNDKGKKTDKLNLRATEKGIMLDVLDVDFSNINSNVVSYKVEPRRDLELVQDKEQLIRNRLTNIAFTLTSILKNGFYEKDKDGVMYHAEYSELVNKVLEPGLAEIGNRYNQGFLLDNGNIFVVGFEKLKNDGCPFNPEKPDIKQACGIITVDINGFSAPNSNITIDTLNDRFRFLIYPNKVLLYPSDENDFYTNSVNNRIISEDLNTEIYYDYWSYTKNIKIEDTYPRLEVIVDNPTDKKIEQQLEIQFFDNNNILVDSWVWNIPPLAMCHFEFEKIIDFTKLDSRISSYNVTMLKERKETVDGTQPDTIGMRFMEQE